MADRYLSPYDPAVGGMNLSNESDCGNVTGFITPRDVMIDNGTITLKSGSWLTPGNFGPVDFGAAGGGANDFRDQLANGWDGEIHYDDIVYTETGNMVGPTAQGCSDLIAQDPSAHVDKDSTGHYCVFSSQYPVNESPRLVPLVMYSPLDAPGNGKTYFHVKNMGGFFIQSCTGGKQMRGTFMAMMMHNATPGNVVNGGSKSSGAAGQLLGTAVLVDPDAY